MRYEIRAYFKRGFGYTSIPDKELTHEPTEITTEQAEQYMSLFEAMGLQRHETRTQIFYDMSIDSNHTKEYIFWKEDRA